MKTNQEKITRPSSLLLLLETRALLEMGAYFLTIPILKNLESYPRGDGHPVLVLPGFTASDLSTRIIRSFLNELGYHAYPWSLGRNLANFDELEVMMNQRVKWLSEEYGRKVSIIGWSLGGIYAREIAKYQPENVRQIITLGSPFAGIGEESNADLPYQLLTGSKKKKTVDKALVERIMMPPPVPMTCIYSRSDGIVSWKTCIEKQESPLIENIEVWGSHCGLGHNPLVINHIAERLAQPEGQWKPFKQKMQPKETVPG